MNLGLEVEPEIIYLKSIEAFVYEYIKNKNEFCISKYEDKDHRYTNSIVFITNSMKLNLIKENGEVYCNFGKLSDFYDYYKIVYDTK